MCLTYSCDSAHSQGLCQTLWTPQNLRMLKQAEIGDFKCQIVLWNWRPLNRRLSVDSAHNCFLLHRAFGGIAWVLQYMPVKWCTVGRRLLISKMFGSRLPNFSKDCRTEIHWNRCPKTFSPSKYSDKLQLPVPLPEETSSSGYRRTGCLTWGYPITIESPSFFCLFHSWSIHAFLAKALR